MIVQGKFMRLVRFVVIVSRIGWVLRARVCVCLFHKKILSFGWKENVVMKILGIGF